MAPLVRWGLWGIGLSVFLDKVGPLLSDAKFTWGERRLLGIVALVSFVGFGLGGWIAGRLFKALAELIDLLIDGADAAWRTADLIELQLIPALGRIVVALEKADRPGSVEALDTRITEVRRAIAERRWERAETLIHALQQSDPGIASRFDLTAELDQERQRMIEWHRRELESGRSASDPDRVIDSRDALTLHLRGEQLVELDHQLVRWLRQQLQLWVRAGDQPEEAARLAARILETFGDIPELSSIRDALPNLRRKAGLCPRCARPFRGKADVCSRCASKPAGGPSLSSTGRSPQKDPT